MHAFRRLSVWRKAHMLTLLVYAAVDPHTRRHPTLCYQMLRCVQSIPANIAEGSGRSSGTQFAHFLQIAIGSARELDSHLQLALDLGVIPSRDHAQLEARVDEVIRMLVGLRSTVKGRTRPPS